MSSISLLYNKGTAFKKAEAKVRGFKEVTRDKRFISEMARFTMDLLLKRIKSGYGVDTDQGETENRIALRFASLEKNYVRARRRGQLASWTSPSKSNVTRSGQMINAMKTSFRGQGFKHYIAATRRKGSKITNAKVAEYVSMNGRPFMALTASEAGVVKSHMKKEIKAKSESYFGSPYNQDSSEVPNV